MVDLLCCEGVLQRVLQSGMASVKEKAVTRHKWLLGISVPGKVMKHTCIGPASALAAQVACRPHAVTPFCCPYAHGALPEKHALLAVREQAE